MKLLEEKNSTIKAKLLDAGITVGESPFVKELFYDLETLIITLDPDVSGKMLRVSFDTVRGFRCLDESDLLNFWADNFIQENWFFEITAGGWFDQEAKGEGFMHWNTDREFFICGVNDCISVLASEPPRFEIVGVEINFGS
jgi:hypothetical protein